MRVSRGQLQTILDCMDNEGLDEYHNEVDITQPGPSEIHANLLIDSEIYPKGTPHIDWEGTVINEEG